MSGPSRFSEQMDVFILAIVLTAISLALVGLATWLG
jgi:heme/copper-type cytochrome/quinol oxidase subunit 4